MENFLKKIFGGSLFFNNHNSFVGVDIGASSIKVVQLKRKGGVAILETYGEMSLGSYANVDKGRAVGLSQEKLSEALRNLLKEANVTTKKSGVAIPLRASLIFTMELPNVSSEELKQMIPIEARKYIPVSVSEVDIDWKIIPPDNLGASSFSGDKEVKKIEKNEVFVVAIHKNKLSKYKSIISGSGLVLNFLEIEIFSTIRSVVGQNLMNFAVLDIGAGSSKLYIVDRGIVKDSHTISRGSQDISLNISRSLNLSLKDAEKLKIKIGLLGESEDEKQISKVISTNFDYIFSEVNKVIFDYKKKYNKNIDKTIITGGGSVIKGLSSIAESRMKTEIIIADPFSKVEAPAFLADLLKEVGPGFAVALGVALRGLNEMD